MENQDKTPTTREVSEATKTFLKMQAEYYLNYFKIILNDDDDPLHFLLRQLEGQKSILTHLQIPWEKSISFVHRGTVIYYNRLEGENARRKTLNLSSKTIDSMAFLAQNTKSIHAQVLFLDNHIKDLKALLGEEELENADTLTE